MKNKNLYDNDELFEVEDEDTVTIPDFVEDKANTQTSSLTDSTSVDMSIFKMSDDELYDDDDDDNIQKNNEPKKKGSNLTLVLCLILIFLLLLTSAAAVYYALRQRSAYQDANAKYMQLQANQDAFQKQIAEKDALIEDLNKQIEELKNSSKAQGIQYEIVDGPISFRVSPNVDAKSTEYNGKTSAENGEKYTVLEIVDDTVDDPKLERKWAKIADDVYFCIGIKGSVWAKEVSN